MRESGPTFSRLRRWSISLNVALSTIAVLALVTMINYLASRHYARFAVAAHDRTDFSAITRRTLDSITNVVKVIVYFNRDEPLYDSVWSLLKEYNFANPRIQIQKVDSMRDPGAAERVKAKYNLGQAEKNVIIFDGSAGRHTVYEGELSELDIKPLITGQSREVHRTHFKGELLFTSALQIVTSLRPVKAYFLQGDGEHRPESDEKTVGYSTFTELLKENNVRSDTLNLRGAGEVPADCNLLVIPGPTIPFLDEETEKIQRYLKQGGRVFVLFRFLSAQRPLGLEKMLEQWGVAVGRNRVIDSQNTAKSGSDVIVSKFSNHPLAKPLLDNYLDLIVPRSVGKLEGGATPSDAPRVEVLAWASNGRVVSKLSPGPTPEFQPSSDDFVGEVPLMVAVEKGMIRGVSTDRGSTRIVVVGDSIFLSNGFIENMAHRDFATYAVNWLLARNELLVGLAPRPIKEYKLTMSQSQRRTVSWILLGGMPGSVLFMGMLVWFKRRK